MADLAESASWEAGIYQLESTDPVLGGPDGIDNLQAKQLANRTVWLKALLESAQITYAPKASPALTGTPTAPTAAPGSNTTQLANTAFVQAAVAALVNASPAALDTLKELATALGNDPNFATSMTNALAAKAPLASPVLTGTPTAPTAATTANTMQLATTAFVQAVINALGFKGTLGQLDGDNMPNGFTYAWHIDSGTAVNYPLGILDNWQGHQFGGSFANRGFDFAAALGSQKLVFRTRADAVNGAWNQIWHSGTFDPTLKANLASPALTGTPTAPTAAPGTNTTQLSTTAFVQAAIAALVAASPAALDTLNELATALGNDPNFATSMTNALAAKAPLVSPVLSGNPQATTQAPGNNSTRIATTAFVQDAVAAQGLGLGQTWQDVRASRAANTTYTNTTGKPIMVTLSQGTHLNTTFTYTVSGQTVTWSHSGSTTAIADTVSFIVPNGATYSSSALNTSWLELR